MLPDNYLKPEDIELINKNYKYALKLELVRTTFLTELKRDGNPVMVCSAQ